MKTISRYIMTLALLLTAVTGAWADGKVYDSSVNISTLQVGDILIEGAQITISGPTHDLQFMSRRYFLNAETTPNTSYFQCDQTATVGANGLMTGLNYGATARPADAEGKEGNAWEVTAVTANSTQIVGITYAPNAIKVTPGSSANTWTFLMPGSDVVLTPIYAKAAAFATTGTEPEVKTQLPEAAEGVIAGTDDPLIAEGTGIVAFAGTSTTDKQGTLMYAIGTSATQAPDLTAFSATVPTAKTVADDGADVYVWYYIKGADTPQGQQATEDNTFNDTEPACLTVTVLTNKFDIQFNAANANTIEAGKATVTVDGTAATVTEGKLQGVKMGTEVKVKANTGYKFRKVEVKKKEGDTGKSLAEATVGMIIGSNGKAYAADDKDNLPEGVTVAAKVCYVDGNGHGLALALADEGTKAWSTAMTICAAHTPAITSGTWKLASKDEWNSMISAAGSYSALRDGFSSVGGTNMKSNAYWSSTEYEEDCAWGCYFNNGIWDDDNYKGANLSVRACLAF